LNFSKESVKKRQKKLKSKAQRIERRVFVDFFKIILAVFVLLILIMAGAGFGMMKGILDDCPDVSSISIKPKGFKTVIYDSDNNERDTLSTINSNRIYIYYDDIPRQNLFRIYSSIFDHFLCFFPLIYKINSVTKLFKYSFQHLSLYYSDDSKSEKEKDKNKIYINNYEKKSKIYEEFYKNRAENPNVDRNMSFIIVFFMIIILSIIISLIFYAPEFKCFLFYSIFGVHSLINEMECMNIDQYMTALCLIMVSKNIIYYSLLVYTIIILFNLWKYEINCDIFYIRLEITIDFFWIILHHFIFHSYLLLTKNPSQFDTLIYNFLIDFSFTLLHLFFIRIKEKQKIKRKRRDEDLLNSDSLLDNQQPQTPHYLIMLTDFNKFMKNIFCYLAIKKYIKNNPDYDYVKNYLDFYIDYYLYKFTSKKMN
jgi:hypothetical protein